MYMHSFKPDPVNGYYQQYQPDDHAMINNVCVVLEVDEHDVKLLIDLGQEIEFKNIRNYKNAFNWLNKILVTEELRYDLYSILTSEVSDEEKRIYLSNFLIVCLEGQLKSDIELSDREVSLYAYSHIFFADSLLNIYKKIEYTHFDIITDPESYNCVLHAIVLRLMAQANK